jgi:E3 ubiquitin-protein ligase BRE1
LLEVCDSLTEENKKTSLIVKQLEQKILDLERKNTTLEQEKDFISINSNSSNLLRYVEDLSQQKKIISTNKTEIKTLTDEKNKLIRLNVERIKLIDKYKDEIKNKNIEMLCLERRNEDLEKTLQEFEKDVRERLSRKLINESEKSILICNLCDVNTKNVAITSCMHTFCEGCIQMRIKLRDRKCPTCGYSFNVNDVKRFYL